MQPRALAAATVAELSGALADGGVTSAALVGALLARIDLLDPAFGALRTVAADAVAQADASDGHRRRHGPRSLLEGIPVVIKDNVDVAGLATTAGALALEHSTPPADAPIVARLRRAGAVILAKSNLSELANFLTTDMPSGYSSLGGQVLNPYDTARTPSGSSSGSGVAVALGLVPIAVGTETDGSILAPSEHQSLVGCKPTLGSVSRTGIVPIAASQDTAGPMARTVADAAALLAVLAGADPSDPATTAAPGYDGAVDPSALAGARIGIVGDDTPGGAGTPGRAGCYRHAVEVLRAAGASTRRVELPGPGRDDEDLVLHHEFAPAFDRYLATLGPDAPVRSMAELREWNLAHAATALKFGQTHVERALAVDHDRDRSAYLAARARDVAATAGAMTAAMGDDLDALVWPGHAGCTWAARSGWPSVTVPAGYDPADRNPFGITLVGRPWGDAGLLSLAAGFERAHPVRRPPWEINPAVFRRYGPL
jgi:amidase